MVIDYSKWDNLELSDDSDVEVHPNVDKKSFIKWKQRDIHEKRAQRSNLKENMKNEQVMNDRLLSRIEILLKALNSYMESSSKDGTPEEFILQTLLDTTTAEDMQKAPVAGPQDPKAPTYSEMLTHLADKISSEIPSSSPDRWKAFQAGLVKYRNDLVTRNGTNRAELEKMEKEDSRKITSSGLRDGFNTTHVAKSEPAPAPKPTETTKKTSTTVEVLNPAAVQSSGFESVSSGAEADIEEEAEDDEDAEFAEAHHATKLGKDFGKIKLTDLRASAEYIARNPSVLAERESDGLLIEAFNAQIDGKDTLAKQYIHQALLLQYCRTLGGSAGAVQMFFKRVTTPGHTAKKAFYDDVEDTYRRIRGRAAEIAEERKNELKEVEQIQLHAVDPNQQIHITIPSKNSDNEEDKAAREIFESFPPGFQKALETKDLDKINIVLGKMSVDEAEEIVGKLSESGMLSLIEEIIDSTTDEGKAKLAEMESERKNKGKESTLAGQPIQEEEEYNPLIEEVD